MTKKGCKRGCKLGKGKQQLTKREEEVLTLITDEFLTANQVHIRLKITTQRIYQIVSKLRKKGFLTANNRPIAKTEGTMQYPCRLHGQQFHIIINFKDYRYKKLVGKILELDSNTIQFHKDTISVHSNTSFYGEDEHDATFKGLYYWHRFFKKMESEYKIIIVKQRHENITEVKAEYADINNEVSRDYYYKGRKLRVKATEDNKTWFEVDNSLNLLEGESKHPKTAKRDFTEVMRHLNDWRDNKPPTNSELMQLIAYSIKLNVESAKLQKEQAAGLAALIKLIVPNTNMETESKTDKSEPDKAKPDYVG